MIELKPCPFCGCESALVGTCEGFDYRDEYYIYCSGCMCRTGSCSSVEEAAEDWNRRADNWISCSEKLPEVKVEVLVTLYKPELDGYFRKIGCFLGDEWLISNIYSSSMENVVAWMPMPDAYKPPKVNSNE